MFVDLYKICNQQSHELLNKVKLKPIQPLYLYVSQNTKVNYIKKYIFY